jgi:fatty-acyl-CoA synthase
MNFYSPRGVLTDALTYRSLRDKAVATARKLQSLGLARNERVAIVAETGADFVVLFFACQYSGLVPCPMPYSMYIGGKDAYVTRTVSMLRSARVAIAITPADLQAHVAEAAALAGTKSVMTFAAVEALPESVEPLNPFGPDEVAYIQYSSGSTSSPKGILISQRAIMANSTAIIRHGLKVRPDDRAFSWLPFYHDMGLVGFCLSPIMSQISVDYLATTAFARRPALWLRLMSDNRCTIAYSPSFGYDLAARRINGDAKTLDLSNWRVAGIGGDMVRPDILELFAERMSVAGFNARAFLPSYGMAESTLAITFAEVGAPLKIDTVDRAQAKLSGHAILADEASPPDRVRHFVSCGKPMPGHEIEVRDDRGRTLGPREIGHIVLKGPSLMSAYFEDEAATAAVFSADGFMDTGDMGYWLDGELVLTGRAKDLILHNGRNIWPQDIEWAAERIEPLKAGDAAAFAVEGADDDDEVVVLIQCRLSDPVGMEELRHKVAAAVHQGSGVECSVVLVPPKSLPFTSSGKLSRAAARAGYLSGEISEIAGPDSQRVLEAAE